MLVRFRFSVDIPFPALFSSVNLTRAALLLLAPSLLLRADADEVPESKLRGFFETHCYECHDDLSAKGGLDLTSLALDVSDEATREKWIRIHDRIVAGEMPPKDEPRPGEGEIRIFRETLSPTLAAAHEATKGTVLRRLNRQEYENTVNDLLGIRLSLAEDLPEDGRSHEFDTVGEALGISMVQMRMYLDMAEKALDAAIADRAKAPEPIRIETNYKETGEWERHGGKAWGETPEGAVVFFREMGYPTGMLRTANAKRTGLHRIRITGHAYQSDKPVVFSVSGTSFQRGSEKPTFGYFSMPPGKPTTIEFETWIEEGYMLDIAPKGIFDLENKIKDQGIAAYEGPGLAIARVEMEGPLVDRFPSKGHELIFAGLERREVEPNDPRHKTKSWYVPQYEVVSSDPASDVAPVLLRFAEAAFRRPVNESDTAPYLILFQSEMKKGEPFERALRTALVAMMCSPEFLYLKEPAGRLDDHALASRLSYFLSRTFPDEELLADAAAGRLANDPPRIRAHAERLLQADHFERFVTDFTDSWLDLRNIDFTNPDEKLFPEFDRWLKDSMIAETRSFFRHQIEENLGIETNVKSDFTFLDARLAEHYGVPGVDSPTVVKTSLPADSPRGGYLAQASVHKVSANGTNTSPVLRGVWINERILGRHPAPPPPGIPGVEPDIRGAETLRQLLDQHRDSESCQSCHEMIDPPGFALESFNPVGTWRDRFRSLGEGENPGIKRVGNNYVRYKIGPPVDDSGILPDGREFAGFEEYRDLIAADRDTLAKAFATKLLVFATGRDMGFSDRPAIEALVAESARRGHGMRDLLLLVVESELFRHK